MDLVLTGATYNSVDWSCGGSTSSRLWQLCIVNRSNGLFPGQLSYDAVKPMFIWSW